MVRERKEKNHGEKDPFPFPGAPVMVPMDKVAVPIKDTGNPRCK
jgi:hypothetical protein